VRKEFHRNGDEAHPHLGEAGDPNQTVEVEIEEDQTTNPELGGDRSHLLKQSEAHHQRKSNENHEAPPDEEIEPEDENTHQVQVRLQVLRVALEVDHAAAVVAHPVGHQGEDEIRTNEKDNFNFKNCPQQTRVEIIKMKQRKNLFYYLPIVLF
jgi:hypothetical protein